MKSLGLIKTALILRRPDLGKELVTAVFARFRLPGIRKDRVKQFFDLSNDSKEL